MTPRLSEPDPPAEGANPGTGSAPDAAEYETEARLFLERLEQTGQLIDVDAGEDVANLPPQITHVRYPDGNVERIGFSTSSYHSP